MMKRTVTPQPINGFTLIELMITLAVAAVLFGIAIPSFSAAVERNRLTNYSNELLGAFMYAASQARASRTTIDFCSSANGSTCDNGWNSANPMILRQSDGQVLRQLATPPSESTLAVHALRLSWNGTTQRLDEAFPAAEASAIRFATNGRLEPNANGTRARRLCLTLGARQSAFTLLPSGQVQIQPEANCP